jgi:hypothetical protein
MYETKPGIIYFDARGTAQFATWWTEEPEGVPLKVRVKMFAQRGANERENVTNIFDTYEEAIKWGQEQI